MLICKPMIIIPAIDLRKGKVVRLTQGDFAKETVYGDNPASLAKKWRADGAEWLHVIDLDGAKEGNPQNWEAIKSICNAVFGMKNLSKKLYRLELNALL